MSDFELSIGKNNKITSEDIKAGIKKEDIKDKNLLSIFDAYDNGNEILEESEISRLKQDLQNVAAEDGDKTELSKREARHLIKNLGINIKTSDLVSFINKLVETSANIKSCTTDDKNITTIRKENDIEVSDIYDLDGNFVRREVPSKYKGIDGTLIKNTDGTIIFKQVHENRVFGSVTDEYYFNNENDFNNENPIKIIKNCGTTRQLTEEFTYRQNGKLKSSTKKDNDNNLLSETDYNENGIIKQEKWYQKNGELKIIKSYEDGIISQETEFFNKRDIAGIDYNKTITKYNNDGEKASKDFIRSDGSTCRHIEYNKDGSIKYDVEYYPNGNKKCEIINDGNNTKTVIYNEDGTIINIKNSVPDGYIGHFEQGLGDCYLLSSIEAIKNTKNGHEYLSSLITKNGDGGYTVTLPGAQKAFKELRSKYKVDKDITGEYKFSADEVKQIENRPDLSKGEIEVRLIEAAFEKYREDVLNIIRTNDIDPLDTLFEAGLEIRHNPNGSLLEGGFECDAIFVLTGERSEVYDNPHDPEVPIKKLQDYDSEVVMYSSVIKGDFKESKASLNSMLDKIMNDTSGNLIAACSFNVTGEGAHAMTIKRVTKDSVILINPWDTSKTITMSRKEFTNKVDSVTLAKMPPFKPQKPAQTQEQPSQNSPSELNPSKPKPSDKGGLTPVKPKQQEDELTPVRPKTGNGGLTPANPVSDGSFTPVKKPDNDNITTIDQNDDLSNEEIQILDKADGYSANRSAKSKIKYCPEEGLTYSVTGNEFKTFTPKDFRKLINDYLNGTDEEKRTIEKIVHNGSNWETAQEQNSTILNGLKLIYNNYEKYKK